MNVLGEFKKIYFCDFLCIMELLFELGRHIIQSMSLSNRSLVVYACC